MKKIEEYSLQDWRKRIKEGYEKSMPCVTVVPYIGKEEIVTYDFPELLGRCPVTNIVDFYRVIIDFIPNKLIPELKSLKFYFMAYSEVRISHEHLCSKIYKDFQQLIKPKKLLVRLLTNNRGGIYTTVQLGDLTIASDLKLREVHG